MTSIDKTEDKVKNERIKLAPSGLDKIKISKYFHIGAFFGKKIN